ncbi:hypothetical protein AMJ80_02800 [bacterium SM23_31]|nr:MAG: hypothetical protein AMJ80_02800 [bacterium SM23_31]
MKCKQIEKYVPDYFAGGLGKDKKVLFEKHLKHCENCRKEVEELRILWDDIGKLPRILRGEELRSRFIEKVDAIKAGLLDNQPGKNVGRKLVGYWKSYPVLRAAAIVVLFLSGMFIGYLFGGNSVVQNGELALMRAEISQLNQLVMLSMLQQPSPSSRLQGINWIDMFDQPGEPVLDALITTLDADPNINVRLASVDALLRFAYIDKIRLRLIESLEKQESPIVQIALIDLITKLDEKRAINVFKRMLDKENLDTMVRYKLESGITFLQSIV